MATTASDVAHLLRRAGFGGTATRVAQLVPLDRPITETAARTAATWAAAASACQQFSRRLPALGELQTYRFRSTLNPPTSGSEWTGEVAGTTAGPGGVSLDMGSGAIDAPVATVSLPFRCVLPATAP